MSLMLPNEGNVEPDSTEKMLPMLVVGVSIAHPRGAPAPGIGIISKCQLLKFPVLNMIVGRRQVNEIIRGLREARDRLYPKE